MANIIFELHYEVSITTKLHTHEEKSCAGAKNDRHEQTRIESHCNQHHKVGHRKMQRKKSGT